MNWIQLVTVSKDMLGLSEAWDINVAWINDGKFAWQTAGNDPDENDGAAIDTGSADWIADYIVENASGFESELLDGLIELAERDSCFLPLLEAVKTRTGE